MKRSINPQGRREEDEEEEEEDLSTVSSDKQQNSRFEPANISFKKKRSLPGNPDPEADVVALSPKSLLATNRFMCEICNKGFQRDQNLQLHKRGHNLPWKLKQRSSNEIRKKKVYICPVLSCVHHDRTRALGDLTGIKKHFSRKHGEKKWKCDKCSKKYAVQSDWKAHSKTCGTKEYRCDCGTLFSRRDSFITHRAFCDALAEESARVISTNSMEINHLHLHHNHNHNQFMNGFQDILPLKMRQDLPPWLMQTTASSNIPFQNSLFSTRSEHHETSEGYTTNNRSNQSSLPDLPPALLQKTTTTTTTTGHSPSQQTISGLFGHGGLISSSSSTQESTGGSTGGGNGYVHDMMLPSLPTSSTEAAAASGLYVSYEDAAAINIHERKKDHGLTRDLLGLRAFSHNDILNMVGLDPIPNTSTSSSSYHHHPQNPWLG